MQKGGGKQNKSAGKRVEEAAPWGSTPPPTKASKTSDGRPESDQVAEEPGRDSFHQRQPPLVEEGVEHYPGEGYGKELTDWLNKTSHSWYEDPKFWDYPRCTFTRHYNPSQMRWRVWDPTEGMKYDPSGCFPHYVLRASALRPRSRSR